MLRGVRAIDDVNESPKKDAHNLSVEKQAAIYIYINAKYPLVTLM